MDPAERQRRRLTTPMTPDGDPRGAPDPCPAGPPDSAPDSVEILLFDVLARADEGDTEALERACRSQPALAGELRRRFVALEAAGLLREPAAGFPERLGEFRLLDHLGGGGMGVVYLARQESLGRDVALKLIRPDLLFFPEARRRFGREVATVARLQHPGIVPVYSVGEEDGVPYFAMEHVRGATLAELLEGLEGSRPEELHGKDLAAALDRVLGARRSAAGAPASPPASGALFRLGHVDACLSILEQVARALQHAHEHGVLHRDLKPSNVLLTPDGRALLFDFGLSGDDASSEITRPGALVGSLPYMAPEQVRGEHVDRRSDVYGLGACLYELLTLAPAFAGAESGALRRAILAGRPDDLRVRNRIVPVDVEVVVRTALASERADRYPTAAALAEDLARARERRPIAARPAGPWLRTLRWTQRHPARAAALALGLLLAVGTPSALAFQRGRANAEIRGALQQAESQRLRAEASFERAFDAVVHLLGEVGDQTLADVPGLGEARARLLRQALVLIEGLAAERPHDSAVVRQHARLLGEAGLVESWLGHDHEAEELLERSARLWSSQLVDHPADRELRHGLARALANRAGLATDARRFAAAEPFYAEAATIWQGLLASDADDGEARSALRQTTANRAAWFVKQDRPREALPLVDAALALADRPEEGVARAEVLALRGKVEHSLGNHQQAADAFEQAIELLRPATTASAPLARELLLLASTCVRRAGLAFDGRHHELAERAALEGLEVAERLVREHPYAPESHTALAAALEALALARVALGRAEEGLGLFERASREHELQSTLRPDDDQARVHLARSLTNLANAELDGGQAGRAAETARRAVLEFERVLAGAAGDGELLRTATLARLVQALADGALGLAPDVDELEGLVEARAPDDLQVRFVLALALAAGIDAARAQHGPQGEELVARRALEALARAVGAGYRGPEPFEAIEELDALRARPEFEAILAQSLR